MNAPAIHRDERTIAVENASYRWGYLLLSYGLLGIVCARALMWRESNWDLMALVVLGGAVPMAYQVRHRILTSRWAKASLTAAIVAAAVAAAVVWLR